MKQSHRLPIFVAAVGIAIGSNPLTAQDGVSANGAPLDSPRQAVARTGSDAAPPWSSAEGRAPAPAPALAPDGRSAQKPAVPRHPLRKDPQRDKTDDKNRERPSANLSPWTAAGALSGVIVLILVLARVFRKHAPLFHQGLPSEALEILGRRFVDQRNSIFLVRIAARIFVIGSGPNGLQPLGEVADPVEVDLVAGLCRRDPNQRGIGGSFFRLLKGQTVAQPTIARPGARTTAEGPTDASIRVGPTRATAPQIANSVDLHSSGPVVPDEIDPARSEQELRRRLRGSGAVRREALSEEMR